MDSIKKLTDLFARFPTIGKRTAGRFVFYLLKQPKENIDELIRAIEELKNNVKLCSFCFNPYESSGSLCVICQNPARSKQLLCIVEKETDLISIENTRRYNGLYFILGGNASMSKINAIENLRIPELLDRIKKHQFTEIIVATNPTLEGKTISLFVEKALKELSPSLPFKVTHLAKGLPVGGELEYADEETLESAFDGRK